MTQQSDPTRVRAHRFESDILSTPPLPCLHFYKFWLLAGLAEASRYIFNLTKQHKIVRDSNSQPLGNDWITRPLLHQQA